MTEPARHLAVVDTETGEVKDSCPGCATLRDQLAGAERDVRAWRARYANLERDTEAEAREHALWDDAKALFGYWKGKTGHSRSRWTADRFWVVEPLLREYGDAMCRKAIDGAAFDPYTTTRRNGSVKRHDDWDLIFRNASKLEEFCNRAPREAA